MDYFQGVVAEYLRSDRASFINTEFYLQNDLASEEAGKKTWYVDVLNINMREKCAYLCEVTFARRPILLLKRLHAWSQHWTTVKGALCRDASISDDWPVRVWLFMPEAAVPDLIRKLPHFPMPPRITTLEMTLPWNYRSWDRQGEAEKPSCIPMDMRS